MNWKAIGSFVLQTLYYVAIALSLIYGKDVVIPPPTPQPAPEFYFGWVDPKTNKTVAERIAELEAKAGCECRGQCCKGEK